MDISAHQAKDDPIEVVLASNSTYFDGLLVTVISALKVNPDATINVHIVDGGLSRFQRTILLKKVASISPKSSVIMHNFEPSSFSGFRTDYGSSYMTYARMLIGSMLKIPRVIYLDTDLLVCANLQELWDLDLAGCICAAAQDSNIALLAQDYPYENDCGTQKYFNAGVMLIDLDCWRRLGCEKQLLAMIKRDPEKFCWWDQTAMNALFVGKVHFLDERWNVFAESIDLLTAPTEKIIHYVGSAKPWNKYMPSPGDMLWRAFYGKFGRSKVWLCRSTPLLQSWLQTVRWEVLVRIPGLSTGVAFASSLVTRFMRKQHSEKIAKFQTRIRQVPADTVNYRRVLRRRARNLLDSCWNGTTTGASESPNCC